MKHQGIFHVLSAKTVKKVLAGTLVAGMMVPAFATSSFAANELPLKDIADSQYKSEILKLNNIGIIAGYEDGTFQPERQVSRAEFARIAVRALGYTEAQAKLYTGNTKFKDVASKHWASGYINLAVSRGILSGDPQGTFRPNDKITVAETLSVFVRGLQINVAKGEGAWYTPFLLEANKLGLYEDGKEGPDAPASRGLIAFFADRFMETPVYANGAYYDKDGNAAGTNKKLNVTKGKVVSYNEQTKQLQLAGEAAPTAIADNVKVYGDVVVGAEVEYIKTNDKITFINALTDTANVVNGIVKSNLDFTTAVGDELKFKAIVNGEEVVLEVTDAAKAAWGATNNIGSKFTAVKDSSGKIASITFVANEVSGLVERTVEVTGTNAKKEIAVGGKAYELAAGATFSAKTHPAAAAGTGSFADVKNGDLVKLTMDVDGKVSKVEYTKLEVTDTITVDTATNKITVGGQVYAVLADTKLRVSGEEKTELSQLANGAKAKLTFNQQGNLMKVEQGTVAAENGRITDMTAYSAEEGKAAVLPTITVNGIVYTLAGDAVVKIDGTVVGVSSLKTEDALNDYTVSTLKYNIGSTTVTELVADAETVKGFVTDQTATTVTVNDTVYSLAQGVQVDADASSNDKEYTLTLDQDGKVKKAVGAVKTVNGVVDLVSVVKVNGQADSVTINVNGTDYVATDASVVAGIEQFGYATLTLTRDGKVTKASAVGTRAFDNVAYKGIETAISGEKKVYHTDMKTSLPLASDAVVRYYDGVDMDTDDIRTTDKVELWTNSENQVYLIVVEKR